MDRGSFDALARMVATRRSRRAALAALLGATLLGQLPAVAGAKRKGNGNKGSRKGQDGKRKPREGKVRGTPARAEAANCCSGGNCAPGPGKNLARCCYQGQNLTGKNFKGANLGQASFAGAILTGANLQGANAGKACFVGADLRGVRTNASTNLAGAIYCRTKTDSGENNAGCGQGTACCPTCDAANACGPNQVCCNGRCAAGECCGSGVRSTCAAGQICCAGTCRTAECCADADCPAGAACADGRCCDVCATGCPFSTVEAAVAGTASGGTIRLCPGTFPTAGVTIAKDLTLIGAGAGADPRSASILDAGKATRVFAIAAGAAVTLSRLTVANGEVVGRGIEGGCIHNAGDLTLDRTEVTGCRALSPDISFGGGVFNAGALTLDRTTITDSAADSGGGIFNRGEATLDNSIVEGNFTGVENSGVLRLRGTTRIAENDRYGVRSFTGTVVCSGTPLACGNPDDAAATAATNCVGVSDASCAGVCLGDATPGSGACPA